ncbi:hypothetical protein FBU59_006291, partial [Linderina macrospora]
GDVPAVVHQDIVGLDIAVHDIVCSVQVVDCRCDLSDPKANNALNKPPTLHMEAQIAAHHQVHNHEHVEIVLEREPQVDHKRMVDLLENVALTNDIQVRLVANAVCLADIFECIGFARFLVLNNPHFAK